jgi:nucleoside-diphosphate-sugar epimerase
LNIVTGTTTTFREIAEMVVALSGRPVRIEESPRTQPMPHFGYRPFDNACCRSAFPDFSFTPLRQGLIGPIGEAERLADGRLG